MIDLRADLVDLHRQLSIQPAGEGGRTVMFISARPGEGTSSIAASFALIAAEGARKPAWLIDLDLRRNTQFNAFAVGEFTEAFGGVGPPYSAALKTQPFFSVEPEGDSNAGLGLFTAHRVGETRLMVTQFDASKVGANQSIRIRTQPAYWAAVRAATDWAVVDAPALQRAGAGLALASQMDRVVIVTRADSTEVMEVDTLRRAIESHGGKVAGVVLNRVRSDARFFDRLAS